MIKLFKRCDQLKLELFESKCVNDKDKNTNDDIEQLKESVKHLAKSCQQKILDSKLEVVSKKTKTKHARKTKGFNCNKCDYECMHMKKHKTPNT